MATKKERKKAADKDDEEVTFESESDSIKSTAEKAKKALKACEKERKEYLDGWKRAKADALNEKKRQKEFLERERSNEIIRYAASMLPVLDSIRMAVEEKVTRNSAQAGIRQIHTQCLRSFADLGITIIDSIGEVFDPHRHQSVGEEQVSEKKKDNTVIKVMRVGARTKDMVIRPAMVRVGVYTADVDNSIDKNT